MLQDTHLKIVRKLSLWLQRRKALRLRIDRDAKCPACGYRRGTITFSPRDGAIKHRCMECGANWGEETLLPVKSWF
jgi:transposase-like protein